LRFGSLGSVAAIVIFNRVKFLLVASAVLNRLRVELAINSVLGELELGELSLLIASSILAAFGSFKISYAEIAVPKLIVLEVGYRLDKRAILKIIVLIRFSCLSFWLSVGA
jgi:hypothetical protein